MRSVSIVVLVITASQTNKVSNGRLNKLRVTSVYINCYVFVGIILVF